jgi:hypothetical protein
MTDGYEEIREALIALLCIGDKIYYIHSWDNHDIITKSYIIEIFPGGLAIQNRVTIRRTCYFSWMEHYEGKLYIWENFRIMRRELKIEAMIEILKSDATEFN